MGEEIVRTPMEPVERPRRGFLDRLMHAAPFLARWTIGLLSRLPATSIVRRRLLRLALQLGWEANNREDWEVLFTFFDRDFEVRFMGGAQLGIDIEPVYYGPAGAIEMLVAWRQGFEELRIESSELIDPGGDRFGSRIELVGRGREGLELRQPQWSVWWLRGGLIVRQWIFGTEEEALEALAREIH